MGGRIVSEGRPLGQRRRPHRVVWAAAHEFAARYGDLAAASEEHRRHLIEWVRVSRKAWRNLNVSKRRSPAVARLLDGLRVPYMVIGGFAVTVWGQPRYTADLDLTIHCLVPERDLIEGLLDSLTPLVADPLQFVRERYG